MELLDLILGNPDRHGGNWVTNGEHVFAIDNGLTMTKLNESAFEINSRSAFKDVVGGRFELDPLYRDKLQDILEDPADFTKILRDATADQTAAQQQGIIDSVYARMSHVVRRWDDIFYFD